MSNVVPPPSTTPTCLSVSTGYRGFTLPFPPIRIDLPPQPIFGTFGWTYQMSKQEMSRVRVRGSSPRRVNEKDLKDWRENTTNPTRERLKRKLINKKKLVN